MSFALQARKEHQARKAIKFAILGKELETRVEALLGAAKENGVPLFSEIVKHAPGSGADHSGKDFTVTRIIDGEEVSRSFGVTISLKSWQAAKVRHSDVPQFCFPLETKPETMITRVRGLFSSL